MLRVRDSLSRLSPGLFGDSSFCTCPSGDKVSRASAENELGDALVAAGENDFGNAVVTRLVRWFALVAAGPLAERGFGFPSQCLASARYCPPSPFLVIKDQVAKTFHTLVQPHLIDKEFREA